MFYNLAPKRDLIHLNMLATSFTILIYTVFNTSFIFDSSMTKYSSIRYISCFCFGCDVTQDQCKSCLWVRSLWITSDNNRIVIRKLSSAWIKWNLAIGLVRDRSGITILSEKNGPKSIRAATMRRHCVRLTNLNKQQLILAEAVSPSDFSFPSFSVVYHIFL